MNRQAEITHVVELMKEALRSDSNFDVPRFLIRYAHLLLELREAVDSLLESRRSFQAEHTLAPSGEAPSGQTNEWLSLI